MDTEAVIARYRAFVQERGWSKKRLSEEADLHKNTLRKFWDDDWSPSVATMRKLDALIARDAA